MRIRVLANPHAGNGAGNRQTESLERALRRSGVGYDVVRTGGPGDGTRLAREARDAGADCLAVVGGDGTLNEVTQAYVDAEGNASAGPELLVVPCGTGADFPRTFGLSADPEAAVERLRHGTVRAVDLGVVELVSSAGAKVTRSFINVASFGLGGLTDRVVNQGPKWWGGRVAYFLGALRALMRYRSLPVRLTVDGRAELEAPVLNVALCNGRTFGGGMLIAPEADPSDGLFDVVAMYDLTRAQGVALARRIYRGTHVGCRGVRVARGARVEAEPLRPTDEILIDLDGETPGRLPLRAWVLPGAVRLRV